MPFLFESQSDLIVPPTLVDRGPARKTCTALGDEDQRAIP